MSVFIRKYKNNNKQSKAYGKTYGRAVMIDTVGVEELSKEMSETCTVTRHDIVAVLSALGPAMSRMLQRSLRVKLPYLGTFKLAVTSTGEQKAEDFDVAKNIKGIHVNFHPETRVNVKGQWENELTFGAKVAELPKNLAQVIYADEIVPDGESAGTDSDDDDTRP